MQHDSCHETVGAILPFLVVEVINTQSKKSIAKKIHRWVQGSRQGVKIIVVLHIEQPSTRFRVFADTIKPYVQQIPSQGSTASGYRVVTQYVIQKEEIYPTKSSRSFNVDLAEVLQEEDLAANDSITIGLETFHQVARQADAHIHEQRERTAEKGGSSPVSDRQEHVTTP